MPHQARIAPTSGGVQLPTPCSSSAVGRRKTPLPPPLLSCLQGRAAVRGLRHPPGGRQTGCRLCWQVLALHARRDTCRQAHRDRRRWAAPEASAPVPAIRSFAGGQRGWRGGAVFRITGVVDSTQWLHHTTPPRAEAQPAPTFALLLTFVASPHSHPRLAAEGAPRNPKSRRWAVLQCPKPLRWAVSRCPQARRWAVSQLPKPPRWAGLCLPPKPRRRAGLCLHPKPWRWAWLAP